MCVSPIPIKNPNFGCKDKGLGYIKDCESAYIYVPCGHCIECVRLRQSSWVQRCQIESLYGYPFFCTLTYNQEMLPRIDINGYNIAYADRTDFKNMVKRIRNDNLFGRSFKYLVVSEFGSKGRPHFHALFFLEKLSEDNAYTVVNLEKKCFDVILQNWSRNIGTNRKPIYKSLCTYKQIFHAGRLISGTFDFHYVQPSLDGTTSDTSFYLTKYLFKPSDKASKIQSALKLNCHPLDYDKYWNIIKPRCFSSLNFGYGLYDFQAKKTSRENRLQLLRQLPSFAKVRSFVHRSLDTDSSFPAFFDVETGKPMPLSKYYQSNGDLYTLADKCRFMDNSGLDSSNVVLSKERHISELLESEHELDKIRSTINNKYSFSTLFD